MSRRLGSRKFYVRPTYNLADPGYRSVATFWRDAGKLLIEGVGTGTQGTTEGSTKFCITQKTSGLKGHQEFGSRGYFNAGLNESDVNQFANSLIEFFDEGRIR